MDKQQFKSLPKIPGVGPSILQDLLDLGITSNESLKTQDPEEMYNRLCDMRHTKIDRCMLYVFRCAIYFAQNTNHDPEKLKWWNWKNQKN